MRRLEKIEGSNFISHQIDRNKTISFLLNNIKIEAFKGDSILSALLAFGINKAGNHRGFELMLDEYLNLAITHINPDGSTNFSAPISRMPAIDGAKYITKGASKDSSRSSFFSKFLNPTPTSLNMDFDSVTIELPIEDFDFSNKQKQQIEVELLIIGAGIAGLSAAKYGASMGKEVLLLEQVAWLGGNALLFGNNSDEEKPKLTIARLTKTIKRAKNVTIKTNSEVVSLNNNVALVQQIYLHKGKPYEKIIEVKAKKIILATGCSDRLPVFHGNRLSKIIGMQAAFRLASAYGVFLPSSSAIITNNNIAYHFALLATNAGAKIEKILDNRVERHSRFFEFAKSYGIKSETGLVPIKIEQTASEALDLSLRLAWENNLTNIKTSTYDGIILANGWLPNLSLWQQSLGKIIPKKSTMGIEAVGSLSNIALAGSNMGFASNKSNIQSAIAAVDRLFLDKQNNIIEKTLDADFETPAGETIIEKHRFFDVAPKYYDFGTSLICKESKKKKGVFAFKQQKQIKNHKALCARGFSLGDMCTLNALSLIPECKFTTILQQRVIKNSNICNEQIFKSEQQQRAIISNKVIANYFEGRFGKDSEEWIIKSLDNNRLEIGQLIFANSDISDPEQALGTIITNFNNQIIALITKDIARSEYQLSVIGSRGHFPVILLQRYN